MTPPVPKIVVAVSGRGRSLENLLTFTDDFKVCGVISSSKTAGAIKVAENHSIPWLSIDFSSLDSSQLTTWLNDHKPNLIVLAGFLKKFPMMSKWKNKVINIHPALLPKFGGPGMYGMNVHKAVIDEKEKYSGATVHFVTDEYDEGAIISRVTVPVLSTNPESLAADVFAAECKLLPFTINQLLGGKLPRADHHPHEMTYEL